MNAPTPLAQDDAHALFERYELGNVQALTPAANGVENSNYFVTLAREDGRPRDVVLTLLEQPSYAGQRPFSDLLDNCGRAGLPVPRLYRNRDRRAFDECAGRPAIISSRLRGQHVLNPTRRHIAAVGRFLARFHQVTYKLASLLPAYPRNVHWLSTTLAEVGPYIPYGERQLIRSVTRETESLLERGDVKALQQSGIHGDLFRDNVLFNRHGLSGVLDFHHASRGYCVYDLAVVVNDWCTDGQGRVDPDRALALLRSYHAVRALAPIEIWCFPLFCAYAAAAFFLSRSAARLNGSTRVKDASEFARIAEQHRNAPLTLDERLLDLAN
ncbi:MAG: phosphotransferase [Pseudomonadota bacterium]